MKNWTCPVFCRIRIRRTAVGTAIADDVAEVTEALFPVDETTFILDIPVIDDDEIEDVEETIEIALDASGDEPGFKAVGPDKGQGKIKDDDFEIRAFGVNNLAVVRDDRTGLLYEGSVWEDHDADTKDDRGRDNGSRGHPMAFVLSSNPSIEPAFILEGNPPDNLIIDGQMSGLVNGALSIPAQRAQHEDLWKFVASKEFGPVPGTIQRQDLVVGWSLRYPKKQNKVMTYGSSRNLVYVTGASPTNRFETVLDIGTRNAIGHAPSNAAGKQGIVDAVWADFADRTVKNVHDEVLTYYAGIAVTAPDEQCVTVEQLLKRLDGRCGQWARFLVEVLAVQGVDSIRADIKPNHGNNGAEVPPNAVEEEFAFVIGSTNKGQGDMIPGIQRFLNHSVVRYGDTYYDPSYGGAPIGGPSPEAPRIAWEARALGPDGGFATSWRVGVAQWSHSGPQADDPALLESTWEE